MNINDNIGGILSPKIISRDDIAVMKTNNSSCNLILKAGRKWIDIPAGKNGTSVNINPEVSDAGTLYSIIITIQIPRQNINDQLLREFHRLIKFGVVMSYKIFTGETFIVGSQTFPLKGKIETIQAQQPSNFSGCKISLTGKQTIPQLTLE